MDTVGRQRFCGLGLPYEYDLRKLKRQLAERLAAGEL